MWILDTNKPNPVPNKKDTTKTTQIANIEEKSWNTTSQATNIPELESILSSSKLIEPTVMTKASPTVTTIRKLELTNNALRLPRVRKVGAAQVANAIAI